MSSILISAMRNEGPFILEWVAYHLAVGFDRIIIFSNNCTDGSDILLDTLAEAGAIEHIRQEPPPGVSAQASAAMRVNELGILRHGDWASWLDADEFLNIKVGNRDVPALIEAIGPAKGILIPWRCFGDNGHARFPGRYISSDFVTASGIDFRPNLEIKTFFLVGPWILGLSDNGINRPALQINNGLTFSDFITGAGRSLDQKHDATASWLAGNNPSATRKISWRERGWKIAQINHYAVRTPEYFQLKSLRGRGWKADATGKNNNRHTPDFYSVMNQNNTVDRSILFHASSVDSRLRELLNSDNVAAAQARTIHKTQEILEAFAEGLHPLEIVRDTQQSGDVVT